MHGARWAPELTLGTAKRQDEKGQLWGMQLELGSSRGRGRGGGSGGGRVELVDTRTEERGLWGIHDRGGK